MLTDGVLSPTGYCFKPKKADCPAQAIPCRTCHNFVEESYD